MYYKYQLLTSLALEAACMVYVGPARQPGKIEVGTKIQKSGQVNFVPTVVTRLPAADLVGIQMEFDRAFEKATKAGFAPAWSNPAIHREGLQLSINFANEK